jgi:hypothetical protein
MSNKLPNDSSLQTTKQMLDELDALMEKMLSLPVNDLEDAPPLPRGVVKAPSLSATLTLLAPPAQAYQAPDPSLPHPAVNPPHITLPAAQPAEPEPMQDLATPFAAPDPAPQPEPLTNEVMPPSVLAKLGPLLAEIPQPARPMATQWGYLPLLLTNAAFDRATTYLGVVGHRLRSQAGRTLLGVSGVALMAVAVGWLVKDWLGWNW